MAELSTRYYAHGCFCWVMNWLQKQKLLVLDERTMQFSSSDIPFVHPMKPRIIVEGEKGKLQGNDGQSANKQQQQPPLADDIISLPDKYRYNILGVAGGYLLVQGIPENLYALPLSERPGLDCFSVNLKTLELEWFCETKYPILLAELGLLGELGRGMDDVMITIEHTVVASARRPHETLERQGHTE
ncbi:hypothetical protein EJB05_11836, partial [Eragrostis curvula]